MNPNHHIKHITNHLEIAELEVILTSKMVNPKNTEQNQLEVAELEEITLTTNVEPHQTQKQQLGDCRAGGDQQANV